MTWWLALPLHALLLATPLLPSVEAQNQVYTTAPANNGAGPLWCYGASLLARRGQDVFISGVETLPDQQPLNNVRWVLYHRGANGVWDRSQADPSGRQREPCPLTLTDDGRLFLSSNPSLAKPGTYTGLSQPTILQFDTARPRAPYSESRPVFRNPPAFRDISYRGFAGDSASGELLAFQIEGHERYHWALRDRQGRWSSDGRLDFPAGTTLEQPQPIRCCYPEIVLRNHEVHVFALSDIEEPVKAWRDFKKQVTKQDFDYDFRHVYYTWTPDITTQPFRPWLDIANQEATCGWVCNLDLWLDAAGQTHLLWVEQSLWHPFMRERFFPQAKQIWTLHYGVLEQGRLLSNTVIATGGEGLSTPSPHYGRFHMLPDGRLLCLYYVSGKTAAGDPLEENRVVELLPDGGVGESARVPFALPFNSFQTATPRSGSRPSTTLDVYGTVVGADGLWYGCVDLANRLATSVSAVVTRAGEGATLKLDGSGSRSLDGAVARYEWEVGGHRYEGPSPQVPLAHGGAVPVTLTVTDAAGHTRREQRVLHTPLLPGDLGLTRYGLVLRLEAAAFSNETGGTVTVRPAPTNSSGRAVDQWHTAGHTLSWVVRVPQTDDYRLVLRYAAPTPAQRSLQVDEEPTRAFGLSATGGYGSAGSDNWSLDSVPLALRLSAGWHTLKLTSTDRSAVDLDYLELVAVRAPLEAASGWQLEREHGFEFLTALEGVLAATRMVPESGHAYTVHLGPTCAGDTLQADKQSRLRLFEDGRELGPAHTLHAEIRSLGGGRFSHWGTDLVFSASDNSDPRQNRRCYRWRLEPDARAETGPR